MFKKMMKSKAKKLIAAMILTATVFSTAVHASSVSPALDIIAGEYGLIKVSLVSRDV